MVTLFWAHNGYAFLDEKFFAFLIFWRRFYAAPRASRLFGLCYFVNFRASGRSGIRKALWRLACDPALILNFNAIIGILWFRFVITYHLSASK